MYVDTKGYKSIQVSPWPKYNATVVNETFEKNGDLIMEIIGEIRREKAELKKPLNAPIQKLTIYAGNQANADIITAGAIDISGACKIARLEVRAEEGNGRQPTQFPTIHLSTKY
jgi:valyl-tRNA synthetase